MSLPLAVFASGGGSNLQALIEHFARDDAPARVALVLSDREGAGALERARRAAIPAHVVRYDGGEDDVGDRMLRALNEVGAQLVALAGFTRLVPRRVIEAYAQRVLNVHPALLPAFGGKGMYGMRVHEAVLAAGCTISGATVHLVDEAYDRGPIIAQWPVPVLRGDSADALAARVLRVEHWLYPAVVEAAARLVPVFGELWTAQPLTDALALPDWADPAAVHVIGRAERAGDFMLVPEQV